MTDPCGTGGVVRDFDRLGDQAGRHHRRKQKDNRGTLRCLVPPGWATPKEDKGADDRADTGADTSAAINALQAEWTLGLRRRITRLDVWKQLPSGVQQDVTLRIDGDDPCEPRIAISRHRNGTREWGGSRFCRMV